MVKIYSLLLLLGCGLLFGASGAKAQTCRVNIGSSNQGCTNYIEVFEYDYVSEKPSFPGGDSKLMNFINTPAAIPRRLIRRGFREE